MFPQIFIRATTDLFVAALFFATAIGMLIIVFPIVLLINLYERAEERLRRK